MGNDEPPLKRERAGKYATRDGRFSVQQESGRWLVVDSQQTDELGLPLVRGPFQTLDETRDAISEARSRAAPVSPLEARMKEPPRRRPGKPEAEAGGRRRPSLSVVPESKPPPPPPPPPIEVRRLARGDERLLRHLSEEDPEFDGGGASAEKRKPLDQLAARRFLDRSDVVLLVAMQGDEPIGLLLAYELPRRHDGDASMLFIHEVRVRAGRRREGIGQKLFEALWARCRERDIRQAFTLSHEPNKAATAFYDSMGGRRDATDEVVFRFEVPER